MIRKSRKRNQTKDRKIKNKRGGWGPLDPLGSPPFLLLIFLFPDFLIILFDFVDFSIDVYELGDILEARQLGYARVGSGKPGLGPASLGSVG